MNNLLKIMFPAVYGTKRSEILDALQIAPFAPTNDEELYSVIVYMGTVTTKDGQSINVNDVIVKSPNNNDMPELWINEDHNLVHELTMRGYGAYRPVHCTPYYAALEQYWSIGMDAKDQSVLHIFPEGSKKQRCQISSVIVEFHFSYSQLMLLLKLKDCSNTLYKWAV